MLSPWRVTWWADRDRYFEYEIHKEHCDVYESLYAIFPFAGSGYAYRVSGPGYWFDPLSQAAPESFHDHHAVTDGVALLGEDNSFVITPIDAPLVQLSGIQSNRRLSATPAGPPAVVSWITNNYWRCGNFPVSQAGAVRSRYRITPISGGTDAGVAERVARAQRHPLAAAIIEVPDPHAELAPSGRFVGAAVSPYPEAASVTAVSFEGDCYRIQLRSAADTESQVQIRLDRVLVTAATLSPAEAGSVEVVADGTGVTVSLGSRRLAVLVLRGEIVEKG